MFRSRFERNRRRQSSVAVISAAAHIIEALEQRTFLNATLSSPISPLGVAPSGAPTTIDLSQHFADPSVPGTLVDVTTPLGVIPIALTDSKTPNTVANFLKYINTPGEFNAPTIIHRSVPGFVIQGGGFTTSGNPITTFGNINTESGQSNVTGTVAMALSSGPNSATSQWFVNLADNSSTLDGTADGGPFTVFGNVVYNGMSVVNAIAALQTVNDSQNPPGNSIFGALPVLSSFTGSSTPTLVNPSDMVTTTYTVVQPLTYAVSSDNPSLVAPAVSGKNLTLTYGSGTGTTQVHVTATDIAGNTASTTFTVGVGIQTVTLGAGGVNVVKFRDPRGRIGHVALTGRGTATVSVIGASLKTGKKIDGVVTIAGKATSLSIAADGTSPNTVMTIFSNGGSLQVSDISITGALSSLNASVVNLTGALTSTGAIHNLMLGNVSGGTLTIGGGPASQVHLGNASNENLFSYTNITNLTANSWTGTSQITAPAIRNANISGSFAASMAVNTIGAFVAGSITGGNWGVPGEVKQLSVQTLTNWIASFGSTGRFKVAGTVDASTLHSTGNIGFFFSTGMTNSNVYAGANGTSTGLPASASDFTTAKIQSFTVNGTFINSNVASQTISKINTGTLQTSNGGKPFGVASHDIPDLAFTIAGTKIHLRKVTTEAQITTALTKHHVSQGDAVISIV